MRALREASNRRVPGRYREDDGPTTADRPSFMHADIEFNKELSKNTAFPQLPLNFPGDTPTEKRADGTRACFDRKESHDGDRLGKDTGTDNSPADVEMTDTLPVAAAPEPEIEIHGLNVISNDILTKELNALLASLPDWEKLTENMKLITFYVVKHRYQTSFVQTSYMLGLLPTEQSTLIQTILAENQRFGVWQTKFNYVNDRNLWRDRRFKNLHKWLQKQVFYGMSATLPELREAKLFLLHLGHHDSASDLDAFYGVSMEGPRLLNIDIDTFIRDGWRGLPLELKLSHLNDLTGMWMEDMRREKSEAAKDMAPGEVQVRLDAPAGSVNPLRLAKDTRNGDDDTTFERDIGPLRTTLRDLMGENWMGYTD